jgi:hypothetical protein
MGQRTHTSTARRRLIGLGLAGIMVVTACSSGSTDESGGNDTTPPTNPPTTTAPAPETETPESTAPATPTTEDSVPPEATADTPPTLSELEEMAFDGEIPEIDVALTEFSLVTGVDVDGALPVTVDEFVPDELTSVVMRLQVLDDQLTDGQRRQIEGYLDEIRSSARVIVDDTGDGDESADGRNSGISAFAGPRNRPTRVTDSEFLDLVLTAEAYVMGQLGGNRPDRRFSLAGEFDREGQERDWAGWATTTERPDGLRKCEAFIVDFADANTEELWETIVHEYFHCWHGANSPGPIADYWRSPSWVVEGLAEWTASEAADTRHGTLWARRFLNMRIGKLYGSSYDAVAFYWQINHLDGGPDALWRRIPDIIRNASAPAVFRAATSGLDPSQVARLASSGTQKREFGDEWTFTAPRLDGGVRPVQARQVSVLAYEFARAGEQIAVEFDFTPPDDEPRLIELVHEGLTVSAWYLQTNSTTTTSSTTTTWCLNPECVCEDGEPVPNARPIPDNDAVLLVALTGGATEQASIKAAVQTLEDACQEEVADPELTGVWIADPVALVEAYDRAYEQIGISVTGAAGELSLTLFPDFTAELRYQDVRLGLSDPFIDEVIVNGSGRLDWLVDDGQLIFSGLADFTVSVVTPALSEDPITVSSDDLPELDGKSSMDYVREGSSLSMSNIAGSFATLPDGSPGVLVFPLAWVRAGDVPDS